MKKQFVRLKLSGPWFAMPFIVDHTPEYICFGKEDQARHFSRKAAANILRRIRSWGEKRGWNRMEVV